MFQLPSFGRIRMVALVIGFFILFWLIGFAKWCFASGGYTISLSQSSCTHEVSINYGNSGIIFDTCTGLVAVENGPIAAPGCYSSLVNWTVYNSDGSILGTGSSFPYNPYQWPQDLQVTKVGNCFECAEPNDSAKITACGSIEYFDTLDDNCNIICKTCEVVSALQAPCSSSQLLDFQCNDLNSPKPSQLIFPPDHPLGRLCLDCISRQNTWGVNHCFDASFIGDSNLVDTYDCATDTGTCKPGIGSCPEVEEWWTSFCAAQGKTLDSFNCDENWGICKYSPQQCADRRIEWGVNHCFDASLIGDSSLVDTYNCDTNTGTCKSGIGTCPEIEDWWTTYCESQGKSLKSVNCDNNTGVCSDLSPNCPEIQQWWTAKCLSEGKLLDTYDCTANTGVCKDEPPSACQQEQHDWIAAKCNSAGDIFISFDCTTHQGICNKAVVDDNGSGGSGPNEYKPDSFAYTPSDAEKSLYTDRFTKFLFDMRSTPLFSLPDQVLGNIPSGGDPIYTIDMGQYGTADIDLSHYSPMFAIVRAVFMTCFSFAALRIVVSHR